MAGVKRKAASAETKSELHKRKKSETTSKKAEVVQKPREAEDLEESDTTESENGFYGFSADEEAESKENYVGKQFVSTNFSGKGDTKHNDAKPSPEKTTRGKASTGSILSQQSLNQLWLTYTQIHPKKHMQSRRLSPESGKPQSPTPIRFSDLRSFGND